MKKEFQEMGTGCLAFLGMLVVSAVCAVIFFPELLLWVVPAREGMKSGSVALWIAGGAVALIGSWLFLFAGSVFGKNDEPKQSLDDDEIRCLRCQALIPPEADKCPKCGWKWTEKA